jgi:hypothetical protein
MNFLCELERYFSFLLNASTISNGIANGKIYFVLKIFCASFGKRLYAIVANNNMF